MFDLLVKAAYHYYVLNDPIMSDAEYDALFAKCKKLEENLPEDQKITNKVCLGYFEGINRPKLKHIIPMLSMEKDNSKTEFPCIQMPKFDGAAVEVVYRNGLKHSVLTRGDGIYGGDITKHNIKCIPNEVPFWKNLDWVIVRGEAIWEDFVGKTHRNAVAGKLNQLELWDDDIKFIAYFLYKSDNNDKNVENHFIELQKIGFWVTPYRVYEKPRPIDYSPMTSLPTDGFVFRKLYSGDDTKHTTHHYTHSWAWKPDAEVVETTIVGVTWSQSKNRTWTPVAIIDPIIIDGTTITKVNLMSLDYIYEKDIAIFDTVLVRKAKEIIPEIASVTHRPPNRQPIGLSECPNCGALLELDGIYLKCPSENCAYVLELAFFCQEIGIKGLADKTVRLLPITKPYELYSLTRDELIKCLGKKGDTIYDEIQKSRYVKLEKLLSALNVPLAKEATFKKIFSEISSWEDLLDYNKLIQIKGIGEVKAKKISDWVYENLETLRKFKELGFDFSVRSNTKFASITICVSGTYEAMTRKQFKELMETKNVRVVDNVTKDVKLLVIGNAPSVSKLNKAKDLGIPIISYDSFIQDLAKYAGLSK